MIKRRFYKVDRGDRDNASESSSSSSGSDSLPDEEEVEEVEEEEQNEGEETTSPPNEEDRPSSPTFGSGSGYQSEDSSGNDVNCDSSGLPIEDDESNEEAGPDFGNSRAHGNDRIKTSEKSVPDSLKMSLSPKGANEDKLDDCVLRCKSVFKCRLCPRIICFNENTLKAHLQSKRHARSKKLLDEGRLKLMLNSDGEIEEDQETHAERHARMIALAEELAEPKKPIKWRKRQKNELNNQEKIASFGETGAKQSVKAPRKKQRKAKD
ncbi:hypothetical protein H6P81_008995 [Aristolochia fimbriata]|uniref:C2H2-type domain-containing protein n=1 Tax=Aristolochia fimbriata TaxID=158543 RepID=A0AAV7EJK2_ARIFI|nr:hypothetical protein H6P81_008995 [Aristolochia fimbriata]